MLFLNIFPRRKSLNSSPTNFCQNNEWMNVDDDDVDDKDELFWETRSQGFCPPNDDSSSSCSTEDEMLRLKIYLTFFKQKWQSVVLSQVTSFEHVLNFINYRAGALVWCSKGHGFEARHCKLDGHFFTLICLKNCIVCSKRLIINEIQARFCH